jgi:hypothetical protein
VDSNLQSSGCKAMNIPTTPPRPSNKVMVLQSADVITNNSYKLIWTKTSCAHIFERTSEHHIF